MYAPLCIRAGKRGTADITADTIHAPPETSRETETLPTIEAVAEHRRQQALAQAQSSPSPQSAIGVGGADAAGAPPGSPEGLEEEASQEGAFNEETGEINWDCPCLGGMAHGPCGEQFKAAFSCFVYSKEEPKGVDCIENFKNMQNCFREHPDMYGAELEPDEEMPPQQDQPVPGEQPGSTPAPAPAAAASTAPSRGEKVADHTNGGPDSEKAVAEKRQRAIAATEQVKGSHTELSETETAVPKAWHDSR